MAFKREILSKESTKTVASTLQKSLADLIDLSLQLKQAHWNVRGVHFHPLHLQLDEIVETVREASDEVAERMVMLGVAADGRLATVSQHTSLETYPAGFVSGRETVTLVADRLMVTIRRIRSSIESTGEHDPVTEDLLIQISGDLEKHLWMIQAQEEA